MDRMASLRATRLPGVAALRRFADRLAGAHAPASRFARVGAPVSPVARVLRRALVVHRHWRASHWQLALSLVRAAPPVLVRAARRRPVAPATVQTAVRVQVQRLVQRLQGRSIAPVMNERVRADRATSSPAERLVSARAAPVRREMAQRLPPLAITVVRHAAAVAPATPSPIEAPHGAAREPGWTATPRATAAAAPLPPQELSRVTEHVIRQLDRRVLSWQERTGRNLA